MKVAISGTMAHLAGNWTRTEMTDSNIDSLAASLSELKAAGEKKLRIDCGQMDEVDASGLQLLYICLRGFRFQGVEVEMINLPDNLRRTLQNLLLKICYQEKTLYKIGPECAPINRWTRRSAHEYQ